MTSIQTLTPNPYPGFTSRPNASLSLRNIRSRRSNDNIITLMNKHVPGEIKSTNITTPDELNYFYHQNCIWILDSNVERQLFIELSSNQNSKSITSNVAGVYTGFFLFSGPCSAWNISVHEYSASIEDHNHLGELLYTFCSRDKHKTYSLPWKLNTVVVR